MYQKIQILNSKLLLPHLKDSIQRKRLHPLLAEIPNKRLTTVIAGAGFGKTTLIAEACNYSGLKSVWYRLDTSDSDFITFISYLIAGIQKHFPEFGTQTHKRIGEAQNLAREREAIITIFLSEIDKCVKEDLVIVFDDFHDVQGNREINDTIEFILKNTSPQVHLNIISRTDPDLPISLLLSRRQVLEIKEDDLALSITEIEQLYSQLFNIALETQSLEILRQKTEGWVSGLILFYHSLRGKNPEDVELLLSRLNGSQKIISNYLEKNVYELQSDEIKNFLIKTSILSYIDVDICNQLPGIDNSGDILQALEEKHLFTFLLDEERELYYYHHLFKEFLQKKLASELGRESMLNLHKEAAIAMEKRGGEEEAMRHYFLAEQFEYAGILFKKVCGRLLKEKRLQVIESYFNKIPESLLNNDPRIQFMKAESLALAGKPRDAINAYIISRKTFYRDANLEGVVSCLHHLSINYLIDGDFAGAESALLELLNFQKGNKSMYIDLLSTLALITSGLGKFDIADQYFNEAMSLISSIKEVDKREHLARLYCLHGHRYIFSGDFHKALKLGEQIIALYENQKLPTSLIMGYHIISWSCYYLGLFSKGLKNAKKGLDLFIENKFPDGSNAWLLFHSALNATGSGKIPEAIINAKESLMIFQEIESIGGQACAYFSLYCAYTKSGNYIEAEESLNRGLNVIQGRNLPLVEGELKARLAEFQIERGQLEEARYLLDDAERLLKGTKLQNSRVYLMFARLYWKQNQKGAALSKLISSLELCEANDYDVWIVSEKHWIIPLLVEAFALGKMRDYTRKIFKKIGFSAEEVLGLLQKSNRRMINEAARNILGGIQEEPPIPGLSVFFLGKFKLYRGDEEIPNSKWKSKKARMILKYLIYNRSQGFVPKDVLMELLWPGENPNRSASRLHVALNSLRKTLEPEKIKSAPSSYLIREADSYRLDMGDDCWTDIDKFQEELKLARGEKNPEKAISHYLNAEDIYHGDFLEEDLYVEWCQEARANIREKYLDLLTIIMKYFETKGDYSRCIEYTNKYLSIDKYAENIYQRQMMYYSQIGNKTMAARAFEKCKKAIVKDLASPLSEDTEALYQKISSSL